MQEPFDRCAYAPLYVNLYGPHYYTLRASLDRFFGAYCSVKAKEAVASLCFGQKLNIFYLGFRVFFIFIGNTEVRTLSSSWYLVTLCTGLMR